VLESYGLPDGTPALAGTDHPKKRTLLVRYRRSNAPDGVFLADYLSLVFAVGKLDRASRHDAAPAGLGADHDGKTTPLGVVALLHGGVKGVEVDVHDEARHRVISMISNRR